MNSDYKPLPDEVLRICRAVQASPRLVAHLTLVHDVAWRLLDHFEVVFPGLLLDRHAVIFGAATHDIGKSIHSSELTKPGKLHERDGAGLLLKFGIVDHLARFTQTHANWSDHPAISIEDLLVALADNCWKGKRASELETRLVACISEATGRESWEVFSSLDDILQRIAEDADNRLAWQAQFSANGEI